MKKSVYLFIGILVFSCNQPKEKSDQEIKIKQIETLEEKKDQDTLGGSKNPNGLDNLSTCNCTCSCKGKVFTVTVYPCKNKDITCERECNKRCK